MNLHTAAIAAFTTLTAATLAVTAAPSGAAATTAAAPAVVTAEAGHAASPAQSRDTPERKLKPTRKKRPGGQHGKPRPPKPGKPGKPANVAAAEPPAVAGDPYDRHTDPTGYTWYATDADGRPAHWTTCRPLTFRVNVTGVPADRQAGTRVLVTTAIAEISTASGYQFTDLGDTTVAVWETPNWWTPQVAGDADILISYNWPTGTPLLETASGVAGASFDDDGPGGQAPQYTRAGVAISTAVLAWNNPVLEKAVLLHELAHALGLGHTDSPNQLMNINNGTGNVVVLQNGDRAGLTYLHHTYPCQKPAS